MLKSAATVDHRLHHARGGATATTSTSTGGVKLAKAAMSGGVGTKASAPATSSAVAPASSQQIMETNVWLTANNVILTNLKVMLRWPFLFCV